MLQYLFILVQFMQLINANSLPEVSFQTATLSVPENGIFVEVCVTVSEGNYHPFTLEFAAQGTAAVNADYVLVPIRYSGNSISCANISIIDDDIEFEANEYFTLTIQGPSMFYTIGSISTLTVTIIDNDGTAVNPPCPCKEQLLLLACKYLEMNGTQLPLPCKSALNRNQ